MRRGRLDPGIEVRGDIAIILIKTLGAFRAMARDLLAERGISNPMPHRWYPLRSFLESIEEVREKVGPMTVFQIGRKIPELGFYPPGVDDLDEVLPALDIAYKSCHRGGDIGSYEFAFTGMKSGAMTCRTPYPCEFDRGLLESLSHRFEPESSFAHVRHDDDAPCRQRGGTSCTFLIDW